MINSEYVLNQVESKYNSLASKIEQDKFHIEQMLLSNEEFSKISYALKSVIFDLQKAKFFGDSSQVEILEKQKNELQTKKQALYEKLELSLPKITYFCDECKDTGTNGDKPCHCRFEHISDVICDYLEIQKKQLATFEQDTLSQVNSHKVLFDKMKTYAKNFNNNSKSLLFAGSTGTGKTFLSEAIAQKVSSKDFVVLYLTAFEFNQILLKYHLAKGYEKIIYYEILTTCDLLVIDDLGAEPIYKNVTIEHTLSIISQRINLSKPFIITTNLSFDNLFLRYGERLYSRLKGKNVLKIDFKGKDLR